MNHPMFKDEPTASATLLSRYSFAALFSFLALTMTGCASSPGSLVMTSDASSKQYTQTFNRAYYSQGDGGEYEVILMEDGIIAAPTKGNAPLASSTAAAPLNQTVHIRVQWRPMRGSKADAPTATNAVINWYVRSNDVGSTDHLHYRGAGFVQVYGSGQKIQFAIRNAHLELTGSSGRLNDPLGPSRLTGTFVALRGDSQVSTALSTIREQLAIRNGARPTPHDGPPPRGPNGP